MRWVDLRKGEDNFHWPFTRITNIYTIASYIYNKTDTYQFLFLYNMSLHTSGTWKINANE